MGIFKPSRVNKREYPGNANVIGPTTVPSFSESTAYCCSSTNVTGSCIGPEPILGCCGTYCYCPCCDVCCRCLETTCTASVPSGMYGMREQYCARESGAWGSGSTVSCGAEECVSCSNVGTKNVSGAVGNCYGFYVRCNGAEKIFLANNSTEAFTAWQGTSSTSGWTAVSNANSSLGSHGWCIFNVSQAGASWGGRSYWDTYVCCASNSDPGHYWTHTEFNSTHARNLNMRFGATNFFTRNNKTDTNYSRAIRTTS